MRLIILIFFSILPGCLQYFIPPQKLVASNFRLFSLWGSLYLLNSSNFFLFIKETTQLMIKYNDPPAKVNFRWGFDQLNRTKNF